jgi:hypothetical protein
MPGKEIEDRRQKSARFGAATHDWQNRVAQTALVATLVVASALTAQSLIGGPFRCDDVAGLDFGNLTIRTAGRRLAFRNGVAAAHVDWKAEIEKDAVVKPAPNVLVRFLLIHDSHEAGSGWRYYLTGLRCSSGNLIEVFHRDGLSLGVDRLDSTAITISLNGTPGEATRKHWSYSWDRSASGYAPSKPQAPLN